MIDSKSVLMPLILCVLALTALSSCCRKCDLEFDNEELAFLEFQTEAIRVFDNGSDETIELRHHGVNIDSQGKVCGGFGPPPDDACTTMARQQFTISGGLDGPEITLTKNEDSSNGSSQSNLFLYVSMGMAGTQLSIKDHALSQGSINRLTTITVNNQTYNDVISILFDPATDCKIPDECVETGDVVGIDFSLSAGLLRFQVHQGLQVPNKIFTMEN